MAETREGDQPVKDMVDLCGGIDEIVLCIKDMAGVGDVSRIGNLVDARLSQQSPCWPTVRRRENEQVSCFDFRNQK